MLFLGFVGFLGLLGFLLFSRLLHLLLDVVHDDEVPRIVHDLEDEAVAETQAVEEVRLREERVLHVPHRRILREEELDDLFLRVAHHEEIHLALRPDEAPRKLEKLKTREILERCDRGALPSPHLLLEHGLQLLVEDELRIGLVVLLAVLVPRAHEADPPEVLEFPADRIDLLAQETRKLTDEVFLFGMEEEDREKLHSRLGTEQCFERGWNHEGGFTGSALLPVHKCYSHASRKSKKVEHSYVHIY